jgi:four helix bundle protein
MGDFKNFSVYQKTSSLAMDILKLTRNFPVEKKYRLTASIRKSYESACSNMAEACQKQ